MQCLTIVRSRKEQPHWVISSLIESWRPPDAPGVWGQDPFCMEGDYPPKPTVQSIVQKTQRPSRSFTITSPCHTLYFCDWGTVVCLNQQHQMPCASMWGTSQLTGWQELRYNLLRWPLWELMPVHPSLCGMGLYYLSTYKSKHMAETWKYSKWEKPDTKGHLCDGGWVFRSWHQSRGN